MHSSFATKFCASVAFEAGIIWSVGSNQFENIASESLEKLATLDRRLCTSITGRDLAMKRQVLIIPGTEPYLSIHLTGMCDIRKGKLQISLDVFSAATSEHATISVLHNGFV